MKQRLKGVFFVALGISLIFPFITPFILRVVVVVMGFYLVMLGLKVFFEKKEDSFSNGSNDF